MSNELAIFVDNFIASKGIKKVFIADKLGIPQQRLNDLFNRKHFTINEANRILNVIGYQIEYNIKSL